MDVNLSDAILTLKGFSNFLFVTKFQQKTATIKLES